MEIISHLLGGENMDYVCMEIENSFQCFDYCRRDILQTIQQEKDEITFEDRKNSTSDVLIAVTKQKHTQSRRERLLFRSAVRLTIMVEPNVGFT